MHTIGAAHYMENEKIRVLIANRTRVLRDSLYQALREQSDIEVVGDVEEEDAILMAAKRTNADCVILPLGEPGPPRPLCAEILHQQPRARVLTLEEGTSVMALYWRSDEGDIRCTYIKASSQNIFRALRFSAS